MLHTALLGVAGSIGGIWLSDALDQLGVGILNGALFPAVLGAVVLSVLGNIVATLIKARSLIVIDACSHCPNGKIVPGSIDRSRGRCPVSEAA